MSNTPHPSSASSRTNGPPAKSELAAHDAPIDAGEHDHIPLLELLEESARAIIIGIGEDPTREGLRETPRRVADSMRFLTHGYRLSPEEAIGGALFHDDYDGLVLVRDIEFYSLCEHHLLPFFGRVHIGYVPRGRVVGLSKLPRLVEVFARRLQLQERLTREIANCLQELIEPQGVGVVVEASHLCMMMRGVQKQHGITVTSCLLGAFRDDGRTRSEFLSLARQQMSQSTHR